MGREQPSFQPSQPSRDDRAKRAKNIINKVIPVILTGDARAKRGVLASELIVDPPPLVSRAGDIAVSQEEQKDGTSGLSAGPANTKAAPFNIALRAIDTLEAAHHLSKPPTEAAGRRSRVAILNMASPLRPGGGVLSGASSQEEWLCSRTTLYPSLREEFYRLPEVGAVYTPDVLVFRKWDEDASELDKKDRFYVDVVTAAMLRFPDIEGEGEEASYAEQKDRDLVLSKMRAVLRIVCSKGVNKVVLGAWGCGAYGNPVREIAKAWRRVLLGSKLRRQSVTSKKTRSSTEEWKDLDIVFAIKDYRMAETFAREFGDGLIVDSSCRTVSEEGVEEPEDGLDSS